MQTHKELNSNYWLKYIQKKTIPIHEAITEKFIPFNNGFIHIDQLEPEKNSKSQISFIFIHGTSIYSRFYAEFCYNMMLKGIRIFAIDLPGHGLSSGKRGHFSMKLFTSAIEKVYQYIRGHYNGKIGLIGSSLGGISSLYSALANIPVDFIICHNAALFHEEAYKSIISANSILQFFMRFIPFLVKIVPKFKLSVFRYLPAHKLVNSELGYQLFKILQADPLLTKKYTLFSLNTQMTEPPLDSLENLQIPTLFINGEFDSLFSIDFISKIFVRIPNSQKKMVVIPNANHLIFQENMQIVIKEIIEFLGEYVS